MNDTTNVAPGDLNYDGYETRQYDDEIARAIPGHRELHERIRALVEIALEGDSSPWVLDLGCGTGITSVLVREMVPTAHITLVDFSEQMLGGARQKLGDKNVEYVLGDYAQVDLGGEYDMVVGVIGLHHQNHEGKRRMFRRVYEILKPGGVFLLGDLMTHADPVEAAMNHALHYHHMVEQAQGDARLLREWAHHHMFLNDLAPATEQVEWMQEVGFEACLDRIYMNTGLIVARKENKEG